MLPQELMAWRLIHDNIMINYAEDFTTGILLNGEEINEFNTFKYLGSIIDDKGSKKEIISRMVLTTSVFTKLCVICNDRNIMLKSKIRLIHSLVSSIFLYACETWTITTELQKQYQRWTIDA